MTRSIFFLNVTTGVLSGMLVIVDFSHGYYLAASVPMAGVLISVVSSVLIRTADRLNLEARQQLEEAKRFYKAAEELLRQTSQQVEPPF